MLWILGIVAALLLLLCLTRVGVLVRFGEELSVTARFGLFWIQVLPTKKKPPKHEKTAKKDGLPKRPPKKKPPAFPKPSFGDVRDALQTLWPPLKKALRRTHRSLRMDPLDLSVILGGAGEPADAARLFGELQGVIWGGMPVLEQLLAIPHPHIHLDVDFTAEETKAQGTVGVSARMGALLGIGMTVAVPALKWLLAYLKKNKQTPVGKDDSDGNGKEQPAA